MRRSLLPAILIAALLPQFAGGEDALPPAAQRGVVFVRYPAESLRDALAIGVITGHRTMPQFRLDPGQVADVIAYLQWLEGVIDTTKRLI